MLWDDDWNILEQKFKPGAPWWSLFGVLSCDEIWKRRRRRGRKACATACSVRIFKIGSPKLSCNLPSGLKNYQFTDKPFFTDLSVLAIIF